jgi:TolB-like protein
MRDHGDENDACEKQNHIFTNLAAGRALKVVTRNSTYTLRKQGDTNTFRLDQTKAAEGGYQLTPNPSLVSVLDLKVGQSLWASRIRDGVSNVIRTSAIQSIEEVK